MNTHPQALRIVAADDEPEMREYLHSTLQHLGHEVVALAKCGSELIQACRDHQPDLVITDIKMPKVDGLAAVKEIGQTMSIPIVLVSAHHETEIVAEALERQVLAYLVKPIKQADLETAIAIAIRRFQEFQALIDETACLRQALEDRKLIEQAKGLLMKHSEIDEPAAFKRLQTFASNNNWKLAQAAKNLLASEQAMRSKT